LSEEPSTRGLRGLSERERPAQPGSDRELEIIHDRARLAAEAAVVVKAEEVKILDMHELVTYTDYFVICTGRNARLTRRIAEEVTFKLKRGAGLLPRSTEGLGSGEWILLDYLDMVVHVFTPNAREFYRLDVLWKQAPTESVE
jgi:ribosome-associated protein